MDGPRMRIRLSHQAAIIDTSDHLTQKIRDAFTIQNPAWLDNEKMNRWNGAGGK